jgi:hypothetical protein
MVSLKQHTKSSNESKSGQQSLAVQDITVGAFDVGTLGPVCIPYETSSLHPASFTRLSLT